MTENNDLRPSAPQIDFLHPTNLRDEVKNVPMGNQRSFDSIENEVVIRENALQVIGVTRGNSIFNDMPDNIYDDMPSDTFRDIPDYVFSDIEK